MKEKRLFISPACLFLVTILLLAGCAQQVTQPDPTPQTSTTVQPSSTGPGNHPAGSAAALVSRNAPAFTNDDCEGSYPAKQADDASYDTFWQACQTPGPDKPIWLAYDLSRVPAAQRAKLLLVWYNTPTGNYNHVLNGYEGYNNPKDYEIEINSGAGGSQPPAAHWESKASVQGNTYHSRQHLIDMGAANWLRIRVRGSDGTTENYGVSLNMDVYEASKAIADDWIFYGASIFMEAMNQDSRAGVPSFQQLIQQQRPDHYPVAEGGGIGGFTTTDALHYFDSWLQIFPGKYVALGYGSNDALSCFDPEKFYKNYETLVQKITNAGKVPLVQKILWGPNERIQQCAPPLNAQLDRLYREHPEVIAGPDTWTYFQQHPNYISDDGIHPNEEGSGALRKLWAETALKTVYKAS
uniref:SGNH hydrolase-type esterase domain-containing protein n=1 Tax=Thermosporothrix sp. COM3 TaxID=2490863 RepID=A0A455SN11_9CHLR|nr:hypothetical protein KTC_31200 [Thermosporothrix sp. COM3]